MKKFLERRVYDLKIFARALKYPNYRLYFSGHAISLIGYWMQRAALEWMVYRITSSPFKLGAIGFATLAPNFFISPFAGVFVDRINRRRLLILLQVLSAFQALALAVLVFSENFIDPPLTREILASVGLGRIAVPDIKFWLIFSLSLVYGLIRSFDYPARNYFTVEMVEEKSNVGSAIALNSAIFNIARLIGPSIAGFVIALAGEGVCFVSNAGTYLVLIVCLTAMQIRPRNNERKPAPILKDLGEGLRYTFSHRSITAILVLVSVVSITGLSYLNLMSVVAKDVLAGDSRTFGFLLGGVGGGALAGAFYVGSRRSVQGLWKILPIATVIFGSSIALSSFSRNFYLTLALMVVTGFGQMVQFACANTLIQNIVEEDKRGRVLSIYNVAVMGILPFGNLFMGWFTSMVGAPVALRAAGVASVIAALVFLRGLDGVVPAIHPLASKDKL